MLDLLTMELFLDVTAISRSLSFMSLEKRMSSNKHAISIWVLKLESLRLVSRTEKTNCFCSARILSPASTLIRL